MGYLWLRFGDPFLFYSAQRTGEGGPRGRSPPWAGRGPRPSRGSGRLLDPGLWADPTLGNLANHLAGAVNFYQPRVLRLRRGRVDRGLRDLPPSLTLYGLLLIAPATLFGTPQSPLMGTPRYVLVAFPIFLVLGLLSKNRCSSADGCSSSALASLLLCALFVTWRFVA